eukprot:6809016-Prymnesium_polylepis.1
MAQTTGVTSEFLRYPADQHRAQGPPRPAAHTTRAAPLIWTRPAGACQLPPPWVQCLPAPPEPNAQR